MFSSINNFFSLLILLLHIGCFTSSHRHRPRRVFDSRFKNKLLSSPKTTALLSFLKRIFSSSSSSSMHTVPNPAAPSVPSPSSSTRSIIRLPDQANNDDASAAAHPCPICAEVFQTSTLLHLHQSTMHAVSQLADGENIVRIIFKMGWPEKAKIPTIHRILKIHNSPRTLARFEEYREWVKSNNSNSTSTNDPTDGRCAADGNELLRFYCTTFTCELETSICGGQQHCCGACGIIRSGFSRKMDGISTMPTSWKAHGVLPEDLEEEFSFMHVKRALLVCRVVAGRVRCPSEADPKSSWDSVAGGFDQEEVVVYNPRAVLPCFVIVYTL